MKTSFILLSSFLAALIIGAIFSSSPLDTRTIDLLQGGIEPSGKIGIIAIDEKSLLEIGQIPWSREQYALLLDELETQDAVKTVAFDIGFFERTEYDESFAQAISDSTKHIVLTEQLLFEEGVVEVKPFIETETGYSNVYLDIDGYVRKIPLFEGREPFSVTVAKKSDTVFLPRTQELIINFIGPPETIPYYSFSDVLNGEVVPHEIVFVGATAPSLHDDYLVPTALGKKMPGVELHAQATEMILSRNYLFPVQYAQGILLLLGLLGGVIALLFLETLNKPKLLFLSPLIALGYFAVVVFSYESGFLLPAITPVIAYFAGLGAGSAVWVAFEQKEKRHLKTAFGKYVSPHLVRELLEDPSKLQLGGVRKELSILFSDIRGFTSLSEELDAEELVSLLNDYLTAMTDIIHEHDGTVDKYIGDAIMAFWNAPLEQKKHSLFSCKTALSMIETLEKLKGTDSRFKKLNIGIGIHTGEVVVGNMGSHERFDYTAIGDNVNLAARLEGLTKQYAVNILISDATKELIPRTLFTRIIDKVRVKGKNEPVTIYELRSTPMPKGWDEAITQYFAGNFLEAKKQLKEIQGPTAEVFVKRCEELIVSSPKKWDGVWTHTSK